MATGDPYDPTLYTLNVSDNSLSWGGVNTGGSWTTATHTVTVPNTTVVTVPNTTLQTGTAGDITWAMQPEEGNVSITDENGDLKVLGIAEVTRLYVSSLEYNRILRFSRLFPEVKNLYKEMLTLMQLLDPLDEEALIEMEKEAKEEKDKKEDK